MYAQKKSIAHSSDIPASVFPRAVNLNGISFVRAACVYAARLGALLGGHRDLRIGIATAGDFRSFLVNVLFTI